MNSQTKANQEVPVAESFAGWAKLDADEQKVVKQESDAVIEARKLEGKSKAAIGLHLRKLRDILEPKRIFVSYLKFCFRMSKATAYRYMELSELAEKILPAPVLEAAIIRGTPINVKHIEHNPPPNTNNPQKIEAYLETLEQLPKREQKAANETDPELLAKEVVNFFGIRYQRLEGTARSRHKWTREVVGMILTKAGISSEASYAPMAIPSNFVVHRGRPRLQQVA